jgi:hypothetical protein
MNRVIIGIVKQVDEHEELCEFQERLGGFDAAFGQVEGRKYPWKAGVMTS